MTKEKLHLAKQIEKECIKLSKFKSQAYNHHIYLDIYLDDQKVTQEIPNELSKQIGELMCEYFSARIKKLEKEFEEL